MAVKAHPELRELLQFAFTGEEEDRKQLLDELREYDLSVNDASLAVYTADEIQVIIEEVLERISDRALKEISETIEMDLITVLAFIMGNFPAFLHTHDGLFDATFGALVSLLRRTSSEHAQTQCFVLIRFHVAAIASITAIDLRAKLARIQVMLRAFDVSVRPNSISYIEKLRAHLNAIETCASMANELHENESKTTLQPRTTDESRTRLERFTLLMQPICELFASVFAREPSELQNTHLNDDVQVAKRCIQRAHEALFKLQEADVTSGDGALDCAGAAKPATLSYTYSYTNTQVFCMANQERVAVTHRLFVLLERLLSGVGTSDYSRFTRSRMLYLALCATWPFALVTLTSSSDLRFNRSLASSALLAFRAFVLLLERSFAAVRDAMRLRAAGTPLACAPSHAAHIRCVQSILRVIDLTMRRSLIESDVAVQMMHTLLCSLSVESLFTRLSLDPPMPVPTPGTSCDSLEEDTKPSVLITQYQLAPGGLLSRAPPIKPGERFLNEIVVSLIFHICIANSSNDTVERPRVICDFFSRLTNAVRSAAASGEMERVSLANVLRFGELMMAIVDCRVSDYDKELREHQSAADFVDRKVFYCAALVQLWTAIATFIFAALTRPALSRQNQSDVDTPSSVDTGQPFRLNFALDNCGIDLLKRTNGLLACVLDTGLRLCRTVIENEPMGVKRESLFNQVIASFDNACEQLCSVYERLFEENHANVTSRDVLAYLEKNHGEGEQLQSISGAHQSERSEVPADGRPACYRVRLEFDFLRVELNNLKSVITKVHSNPFLSNGKWCDVKPRRQRRNRSGFPKPRPKSKQRSCARSMSHKPAVAKPADKYARFAQQTVHVGRGQFSKPRLAGLSSVSQPRLSVAPPTLALRCLSAPCASDSSFEERCTPLVRTNTELASERNCSSGCLLISAPTTSGSSLSSHDAPNAGKDDEKQASSPNGNDAESYATALDVFGADLTEVDEADTAALLNNFIENFDVDTALPLQPPLDCAATANIGNSLEVFTDDQVSPICNQIVVEADIKQMPVSAVSETLSGQPTNNTTLSELDTTEIPVDGRTTSDTRLVQNHENQQEAALINGAEPVSRAVDDDYELLD